MIRSLRSIQEIKKQAGCEFRSLRKEGTMAVNATNISPELYTAAVEGNIEPFMEASIQLQLTAVVTPIQNTLLHLNIASQTAVMVSAEFVERILGVSPSLLLQVNAKGETPLHVAAKWGHTTIVRALIQHAKDQHEDLEIGIGAARQMLRMTNNEGNTALHEAVQRNRNHVVGILTREDPDFSYSANRCHETPLYIAVLRGSFDMVVHILNNCTSPAHEGPNGKTALHEAVICKRIEIIRELLERKKSLTKETDENGWMPLHYAAYYGHITIAKELLEVDASVAYIGDKQRNMTPLHMAAGQGNVDIMRHIAFKCPDCCELVDIRGWNALHFAMVSLSVRELRIVLQNQLLRNLLYDKDVDGSTPGHVLAHTHPYSFLDIMNGKYTGGQNSFNLGNFSYVDLKVLRWGSLQLKQEIVELCKPVGCGPYPHGVIHSPDETKKGQIGAAEKARGSHLVVNTLIATVTFAAAFTLPGGYKGEKDEDHRGTAILTRESAFQAFVITNAFAMLLSLSAVFFHFIMAWPKFQKYLFLFALANVFSVVAIIAMVIAFITGTYGVLSPSTGFAISTCLIGVCFLLFLLLILSWVILTNQRINKIRRGLRRRRLSKEQNRHS